MEYELIFDTDFKPSSLFVDGVNTHVKVVVMEIDKAGCRTVYDILRMNLAEYSIARTSKLFAKVISRYTTESTVKFSEHYDFGKSVLLSSKIAKALTWEVTDLEVSK